MCFARLSNIKMIIDYLILFGIYNIYLNIFTLIRIASYEQDYEITYIGIFFQFYTFQRFTEYICIHVYITYSSNEIILKL